METSGRALKSLKDLDQRPNSSGSVRSTPNSRALKLPKDLDERPNSSPTPKRPSRLKRGKTLRKILVDCCKIGRTTLCSSYPSYLSARDQIVGNQYKIEVLPSAFEEWKQMYNAYKMALLTLPSSGKWDAVHWIGSTAVPGLVAKPIIDMMIVTSSNVTETLHEIALETADPDWRESSNGLAFPVGFQMKQMGSDWGFLQMPGYEAKMHNIMECNLHIFHTGTPTIDDKLLMRNFLRSAQGKDLTAKYGNLKLKLEERVKNGSMASAEYNKEKCSVIMEVMAAAKEWKDIKVRKSSIFTDDPVAMERLNESLAADAKPSSPGSRRIWWFFRSNRKKKISPE